MKIAFLTGMSNYGNNLLSYSQLSFMNKIQCDNSNKLLLNFPYIENNKIYKSPNILQASFSNTIQYFLSKTSWINKGKKNLINYLDKEDKIILLVGSCGLELFRNMNLEQKYLNKVHLLCYGAVAQKIPDIENIRLIIGDKDWISKWWIKEYDFQVKSNHMNYLDSEDFLKYINHYLICNI